MKSTLIFLAMILFVSATQDMIKPEFDQALLEITKEPQSEAILATMSIQMETQDGFHRVLSLLRKLVRDSRAQLHGMTKVWRGVAVRCQVSDVKLGGRLEFFQNFLAVANRNSAHHKARVGELRDHLKLYRKAKAVYEKMLKAEIDRHRSQAKMLQGRINSAKNGLKSLQAAQDAVKNWSPKSAALIQTHLTTVSESYLKAKNMELPEITELLERTTDRKVRKRLLEWMSKVAAHLKNAIVQFRSALASIRSIGKNVEAALAAMINALKNSFNRILKAISWSINSAKESGKVIKLYTNLAKQTQKIIRDNKKWCAVEKRNFKVNSRRARSAINLFVKIKVYFVKNYRKIHNFIKTKYHLTPM